MCNNYLLLFYFYKLKNLYKIFKIFLGYLYIALKMKKISQYLIVKYRIGSKISVFISIHSRNYVLLPLQ